MAGLVTEDTYHFLGGPKAGTQAGAANAGGGCTKVAWESSLDLTDFMGANGDILVSTTGALTDAGNGDALVTKAGVFGDVVNGTICYLHDYAAGTDGRYEIMAHTADTITLDGAFNGAEDPVSIEVGGSFDTFQNALDKIDEADNANRYLWVNRDDYQPGAVLTVNCSGSVANDYHVFIKGFYSLPGDMDVGGTYYGGAWDAYCTQNSYTSQMNNSSADWCRIDFNNGAYHGFKNTAAGNENLHIENLFIDGINAAKYGIAADIITEGFHVHNCWFGGTADYMGIWGGFHWAHIDECYFGDETQAGIFAYGDCVSINNCICEPKSNRQSFYYYNSGAEGGMVHNCLMIGGTYGIIVREDNNIQILNNTFYNISHSGIRVFDADATVSIYNNIFEMAAASDYAVYIEAGSKGTVLYCDYNCTWNIDTGAALTNPFYSDLTDTDIPQVGSNNIEKDPGFVDPDNGDFTVGNWELMESGKPDVRGNPCHTGCIGKPAVYDIIYAEEQTS